MIGKVFSFLALSFALTFSAAAQQGGQTGGNQGGGNQGGGNQGGNTGGGNQGGGTRGGQTGNQGNRDPFGGQQQQQIPQYRPIYLSGKVVMDTGEVPPEPVVIVRVCNGQNYPEGYTNSKGTFSFEVGGDPSAALSDASVGNMGQMGAGGRFGAGVGATGGSFGNAGVNDSMMGVDMTGCEIRAQLPGFQSDSLQLGRRRPLDNPDIGVIVLHSLGGVKKESIVSVTTLEAPDKARSSYEKGMRELSKKGGNLEKAVKELDKAVELYPKFAAAWSALGTARIKMGDMPGATDALEKAIAADPDYLRPYPELVQISVQNKDWQRTSELSDAMLALNPGQTQVRYYKAVANFSLGKSEAAEAAALEIQQQQDADQYPQTHQMLGMIAGQRGQFENAAKEYRRYLELAPEAGSAEGIRKQLHEWEELGVIKSAEVADAKK